MLKSRLPNTITCLRIAGSTVLLAVGVFSTEFYVLYTLCGLTDVLDGWIARATHTVSELGAKLDSIADLLFYALMILRILPVLVRRLPRWIWQWVLGIVLLRVAAYLTAAVKFRRFAALHTLLNKATGLLVFLLPYTVNGSFFVPYCTVLCAVATAASGEELMLHLRRREYIPDRRGMAVPEGGEEQAKS